MSVLTREQLANNAQSTLSSGCSSSDTTLTLASGSGFPSGGNFHVIADSEIMLCTAISSNLLTVVRAQEGTSAASHSSSVSVAAILSVGSLLQFLREGLHTFGGSPPTGRILDASGNILTSSSFTIVNAPSATITDAADGSIVMNVPASTGSPALVTLLRAAPGTPYSIQCAMQYYCGGHAFQKWRCGLCLSDGTKFITSGILAQPSTILQHTNSTFSDSTTLAANYDFTDNITLCGLYTWLKITDDGTNLYFFRSYDGQNWIQDFQVSRTDYLTSGPSYVGFFADNETNSSSLATNNGGNACVTFAHYSEG